MWLAKYLTDLPRIQSNLRSVLHQTLSTAREEHRVFTFDEIRRAKLPYFYAVIEEMLRINAVPVTREALCDTTILGCPIKKGHAGLPRVQRPGLPVAIHPFCRPRLEAERQLARGQTQAHLGRNAGPDRLRS